MMREFNFSYLIATSIGLQAEARVELKQVIRAHTYYACAEFAGSGAVARYYGE